MMNPTPVPLDHCSLQALASDNEDSFGCCCKTMEPSESSNRGWQCQMMGASCSEAGCRGGGGGREG